MSRLLELRAAIIAGIKTALPGFKDVEGHLGRFTEGDLTRFIMQAPAIRVAILGLTDSRATGEEGELTDCTVKVAIYVVTKDVNVRLSRDAAALAAVEAIVGLANGNRWGLKFAKAADAPTAQNLFSNTTLDKGVALWAIDLPQPVRLGLPADLSDPENPLRELFVGVAPRVGAAHIADYVGPVTPGDIEGGHD